MRSHSQLTETLSNRDRSRLVAEKSIECGVLIPLLATDSGYEVLYTLRSEHLPDHKGQVAFPGGKRAPEDANITATATREANEEVGIDPADVEILGLLDDIFSMEARYVVTPVVGVLPYDYPLRPNPHEVADVFTVAVRDLLDRSFHETEMRPYDGVEYEISKITAGKHVIWGLTHAITMNLIECLESR